MDSLGKVIGFLIAAIVVLAVIGFVVRAVRWLLIVALVVAVITALVGAAGSRREP